MTVKSVFVAAFLSLFVSQAFAQTIVNPDSWSEQKEGLAVASAQKVTTKPTKIRMFSTLAEADSDVKKAVTKLAEKKKTAIEKLKSIDVKEDAIQITETKILEWNRQDKNGLFFWRPDNVIRVHQEPQEQYTTYAAIQVDWEIKDLNNDELIVKMIDLMDRIKQSNVFAAAEKDERRKDYILDPSPDIYFLFVGEISEEASIDACKRAYEEAHGQAMKIAAATGQTLGKVKSITSEKEGCWWGFETELFYDYDNEKDSPFPDPRAAFRHSPSEVSSVHPANLYRVFKVELRYEIK